MNFASARIAIALCFLAAAPLSAKDTPFSPIVETTLADMNMSYELRLWFQKVKDGDLKDAAHRWTTTLPLLTQKTRNIGEALYIYALSELNTPNTFVKQLIKTMSRADFRASADAKALEKTLGNKLTALLTENWIVYDDADKSIVHDLPWEGLAVYLKSWGAIQDYHQIDQALAQLPKDHPWRGHLSAVLVLQHLRKNEAPKAITVLANQLKEIKTDSPTYSDLALQLGRIYFQLADLKNAELWYEKVSKESRHFLDAQEELLWVWLRNGNMTKLKNSLAAFEESEAKKHFMPEVFVVRAIANIKLCSYDEAKKDFGQFVEQNSAWAQLIDKSLKEVTPEQPLTPSFMAKGMMAAVDKRKSERETVSQLLNESIAASLPAVGKQSHWKTTLAHLDAEVTKLEKMKHSEFRKQWRNDAQMLDEAIRKMKFVKIELISQVREQAVAQASDNNTESSLSTQKPVMSHKTSGQVSFPIDDVAWSDEIYKLRADSANICL
jgi:tetratricopeptide (TPR) repeat protein